MYVKYMYIFLETVYGIYLSANINGISILEKNLDKIHYKIIYTN